MASISWPSNLADVLVSGATIRGRGLQAWWSMNTIPELPDNVSGTTYVQDAWVTADGWGTAETISYPSPGTIRITGSSGVGYILIGKTFTYTASKNIRLRIRTSEPTSTSYWRQTIGGVNYDTILPAIDGFPTGFKAIGIVEPQAGIMQAAYLVFPDFGNGDWVEIDWIYIGTEAYDTLLVDNSGNLKTASITAVLPVQGVSGIGAGMNSVNSFLMLSSEISLYGKGSIAFSFKGVSDGDYAVLTRSDSYTGLIFIYAGGSIKLEFINDAFEFSSSAGFIIYDDNFHNYLLTFGANGGRIYRDGILHYIDFIDYSDQTFDFDYIGRYITSDYHLHGTIDEIKIYNIELSQSDAISLNNNPGTYEALPEYPDYDGFGEVPQNGTIRSTVDSGPPKVRRRFTALTTIYNVQYQLTQNQKQLLDYFYRTTTAQGSLDFNFEVPDGNTVEARFLTQPSFSAQEQGAIASFQIEVLP